MKTFFIITLALVAFFLVGYLVLGVLGFQIKLEKRDSMTKTEKCVSKEQIDNNLPMNNNQSNQVGVTNSQSQEITELMAQVISPGNGAQKVQPGDTITVHYVGTLTNGTKFDSSVDRGQPFQVVIGVGQVIQGWDKGIVGMQVGEKRKLFIPADLAYGAQGAGNAIPPNSALIFEVELISIDKTASSTNEMVK
ncbi:MAG TPA: FKBP-type peptidyl-prolyl cis-trans isomerase [bacterium]|nr:FKBP-type peptidyl-prolyl cis-trans isomerase [bacterium]